MASYIKVRAISRSQQVRIGDTRVTRNVSVAVDIDNPKIRRDLERFQALGAVIVVGGLTSTAGDAVTSGGVVDGGANQADLALRVSAGTIRTAAGATVAIVAGTPSVAAADGTNPRIDNVVANTSTGVVTVVSGTAAATPVAPAVAANTVKLAEVSVPALDTSISDNQITDSTI